MAHGFKSVRHLLQDKPALKHLELELKTQSALLTRVRQLLPGEMATHCVAARRDGQQLVLHTDSPVWASRLRFMATELRSLLQNDDPRLRDIKIRLIAPRVTGKRPPRQRAHHSDFAAAVVADSADAMQQGPLRAALQRLSKTLKREN